MQSIFAEARKQRSFREARIGALLAVLFLAVFIGMDLADPDTWAPWYFIQQDIRRYVGALTAFLLVIGLSRLMCYETERKTAGLIGTAARGAQATWGAKVGLSVLYCGLVVSALGAATLGIRSAAMGFQGARRPVTDCVYFESVPMSNISFCVLQYVFLFLGALYFAGFILLVGAVTKRTALTVSLCGGSWLALLCYQFYFVHFLQRSSAPVCRALRPVCAFVFRFSFCGFMQLESYRWSAAPGSLGQWEDVWKPVLFVLAAIAAEFLALGFLWRRGSRT